MNWRSFILPAAALVSLGIATGKNPYLLLDETALGTLRSRETTAPPVLGPSDGISDSPATFHYMAGPDRNGAFSSPLPIKLRTAWHSTTLNAGIHTAPKSSPAIDKSGVYVPADTGWIHAFDRNGNLRWRFQAGGRSHGFHSTPALDEEAVYIGAYNGRFYKLNKSDGQPMWIARLGGAIGASALLNNELMYVSVELLRLPLNGYVVALERSTGKTRWISDLFGNLPHSSPTLCGEVLIVGANSAQLFALDLKNGRKLWSRSLGGPMASTALVHDGNAYFTDNGGHLSAVTCSSGQLAWEVKLPSVSHSNPTYLPSLDAVAVADTGGHMHAFLRTSGKKLWSIDLGQLNYRASAISTPPTPGQPFGLLWTGCLGHSLCALNPKTGARVAQWILDGQVSSVPSLHDGLLCVSPNYPGRLTCFVEERAIAQAF